MALQPILKTTGDFLILNGCIYKGVLGSIFVTCSESFCFISSFFLLPAGLLSSVGPLCILYQCDVTGLVSVNQIWCEKQPFGVIVCGVYSIGFVRDQSNINDARLQGN